MASPEYMDWYSDHEHDHIPIYVNAAGQGPMDKGDPDIVGEVCLECGDSWPCASLQVTVAIAIAARPIVLTAPEPRMGHD